MSDKKQQAASSSFIASSHDQEQATINSRNKDKAPILTPSQFSKNQLAVFKTEEIEPLTAEDLVQVAMNDNDGGRNLCNTIRVDVRCAELIAQKLRPEFNTVIRKTGCFLAEALFDSLLSHRR